MSTTKKSDTAPAAGVESISTITQALEKTTLNISTDDLVDTPAAIASLLDSLINLPTSPPSLYLDPGGIKLSRYGTISILQIYILPTSQTLLLDIHTLKALVFLTPSTTSPTTTLQSILESPSIPKAFFDVRNDSDALFTNFNIRLQGIIDIQLLELATRSSSCVYLSGLGKCIDLHLSQIENERYERRIVKEKGKKLFAPEKGGSYEVFNRRPLDEDVKKYCVQDVELMPGFYKVYMRKLGRAWVNKVIKESKKRVRASQGAGYEPNGSQKARAPWGW